MVDQETGYGAVTRRTLVRGMAAAGSLAGIGMPFVARAADPIRIGFPTPITGPLGRRPRFSAGSRLCPPAR